MESVFSNNSMYNKYNNGMTYSPQKELTWTNALTPEEEKTLHKGPSSLSLEIPKEAMYRAKCTHRDPKTKMFTVRENNDGTVTCMKCGARFNPVNNVDIEKIRQVIGGTIDILQTAKMAYIDMTPEAIQTYFIILPFLEIAPKLYEAAMQTLGKIAPGAGVEDNYVSGDLFGSLYSAVGTPPAVNPAAMAAAYAAMMGAATANGGGGMGAVPNMTAVPYAANPMQTTIPGWGTMAGMTPPADAQASTGQAATESKPNSDGTAVSSGQFSL